MAAIAHLEGKATNASAKADSPRANVDVFIVLVIYSTPLHSLLTTMRMVTKCFSSKITVRQPFSLKTNFFRTGSRQREFGDNGFGFL